MKKLFASIVLLATTLLILVLVAGCNPFIRLEGKVYEWVNAPENASSEIYIETTSFPIIGITNMIEGLNKDITKVPLGDVVIQVREKKETKVDGDEGKYYEVNSDINGDFDYFSPTAPTQDQLIIKVSKPGYCEVAKEVTFISHGTHYTIVALLVRQAN